jgi:hypothetical protein
MSLRWDPLLARAVARELDTALRGRRVRALLLDGGPRTAVLYLRDATLVAELHPRAGWISLLDPVEPPLEARPLPCRVLEVAALPDESALRLGLQRIRGKDEGVELILDFAAGRGNALVVGHRSGQLRHVLLPRATGERPLVPGAPWVPLPTGDRRGGPGTPPLPEPEFRALVAGGRSAVLGGVAGASSLNVEALLGPRGWEVLQAMRHPEHWGAWITPSPRGRILYPILLDRPDPVASHVSGGPGVDDDAEATPLPSLLEGMGRLRDGRDGAPVGAFLLPGPLVARAEERLVRLRRKVAALRRQLDGAPDPAPLRALGDLILARFAQVPTGKDSVRLPGFDGGFVEVALDPTLPVHENARRYYDEAARAERARAELPARVDRAESDARALALVLDRARSGSGEVSELEALLGPDPSPTRGAGSGGPGARGDGGGASLPYRRFTSSGGLEIRVGRGARRNDDLTFRHAAPDDVWLHVREAPGAHVVLRWRGAGNPPARDLEEAAILAAVNSEARHAGLVPVDWTRRKYVRKPRKAPPGAVLPDRVQTIFVAPDPGLPDRLAPSDG